jgi:hypothetical protein
MQSVARTYLDLLIALQEQPESHQVEVLSAEIAAAIARGASRTVGIVSLKSANAKARRAHGLAHLVLEPYGLCVAYEPYRSGTAAWLRLEQIHPHPVSNALVAAIQHEHTA